MTIKKGPTLWNEEDDEEDSSFLGGISKKP
jgi:hypothetical protein